MRNTTNKKLWLAGLLIGMLMLISACALAEAPVEEATAEPEPEQLYPFTDVQVYFTGWNGSGTIDRIDTTACDPVILENVTFQPAEAYSGLTEGDMVTIQAVYDEASLLEKGYAVAQSTCDYAAEDLWKIRTVWDTFHDDVTWLEVWFSPDETADCLVDIDGNVLYKCVGENFGSNFYNGVAQMDDRLIDKHGNTIWSKEDAYAYGDSVWGPGNTRDVFIYPIYEDNDRRYYGYTSLYLTVDCFDFSGSAYGIIDSQGNWLVEPVRDKSGYLQGEFGVFRPDGYSVYNAMTGEYAQFPETDESYDAYNETYRKWVLHNEAILEGGLTLRLENEYENVPTTGFYDENGELKVDLSEYDVEAYTNRGTFYNGCRSLRISNAEGGSFYTIFDMEGNRVLYPIREWFHGPFTGEYFVRYNDDAQGFDDQYYYCNAQGENTIGKMYSQACDFMCGRAFVRQGNEDYHCIDLEGNIVF